VNSSLPPTPSLLIFPSSIRASSRSTLPTDCVARISDSFDFPDPRGEFNGAIEDANARARARERERERRREKRDATEIETFLGIGCQIESGGTSTPYRSTRRRVCRMFNDGRGRFRVSETGPPNPRLTTPSDTTRSFSPVRITISRTKTRSSVIYIDERGTREGTSIVSPDVGNEDLSRWKTCFDVFAKLLFIRNRRMKYRYTSTSDVLSKKKLEKEKFTSKSFPDIKV